MSTIATEIERRCGTCRFWAIEAQPGNFKERLKKRYQINEPCCRHDGKCRLKDEGKGCLGWKEADPGELEARGYGG